MLTRALQPILLLALLVTACATTTPRRPETPPPTRMQPEDAAQSALSDTLAELDHDLEQARSLLIYLAGTTQVRSGSSANCATFVRQLLNTNPQFSEIGATTPDGILFCDSTERDRTFSVADRLYFSRTLSTHEFTVGEYVIGRVTTQPSLGLAYPILDDSQTLRGIVMAPLSLGWLARRISDIEIPVTGEIVLLDSYGNILIRDPDAQDWLGRNVSDSPLGKAMLARYGGSGEFAGADGQTRFYAFGSPQRANHNLIAAVGIKK